MLWCDRFFPPVMISCQWTWPLCNLDFHSHKSTTSLLSLKLFLMKFPSIRRSCMYNSFSPSSTLLLLTLRDFIYATDYGPLSFTFKLWSISISGSSSYKLHSYENSSIFYSYIFPLTCLGYSLVLSLHILALSSHDISHVHTSSLDFAYLSSLHSLNLGGDHQLITHNLTYIMATHTLYTIITQLLQILMQPKIICVHCPITCGDATLHISFSKQHKRYWHNQFLILFFMSNFS